MKKIILPILFLILVSCTNLDKSVYWCGDHPCVNKKEKEEYFRKHMMVEKRILNKENNSYISEIEKITSQAKENQKQRIKNEKEQNKLAKLKEKKIIKEEKRLKKEAKAEKKRRLKEHKKMIKELKIEENKSNIKKKPKQKTKQIVKITEDKTLSTDLGVESNKFDDILEEIINRNSLRKFPDINNIPN